MTDYYTSSTDGNNAYDGLAPLWTGVHGPKLTIAAGEALLAAGDTHHIRPGVYRELVTWGMSGGNAYTTGTVNVTNGSAVVTGVGTLWLANVAANYMFHNIIFASGADGVTNGTATFTSAAGNFQAAMIGQIIQINTKGAYKIDAVGGLNTITLSDPNGLGWPAAGVGLTYSVMSGMEPFGVLSVDGNTQLTLTAPWYGPTLTGIAYITYNPIIVEGDVTGKIWGVGGTVRITGSDNDQTATRANCVAMGARSYRVVCGLTFDLATTALISSTAPSYVTLEDCNFSHVAANQHAISIFGAAQAGICIRRCEFLNIGRGSSVIFSHTVVVNSAGHLVSDCNLNGMYYGIVSARVGGICVKNNLILGCMQGGINYFTAPTVGQTMAVLNSEFQAVNIGLVGLAVGQITPNFCTFSGNVTNYSNVTAGVNDVNYPSLFAMPTLHSGQAGISGFRLPPPMPGELSQWSPVRALAGFGEPPADLFGLKRPATSAKNSWGPIQYQGLVVDTTDPRSGTQDASLPDAGRMQIIIPVEAVNTTVSVYVKRGANYAWINPQMILKQPGQADIVVTDAGGAGAYNQLTHTWIPAATPNWIVIELVSNNTALAGAYGCFFDDLFVSPLDTDTMEAWTADVQHINYAEELTAASAAFSPVGSDIVKG